MTEMILDFQELSSRVGWLCKVSNSIHSVRGAYVSFENIKLSCITDICSGRENFVHNFRRKTMNIFVYFG